MISLFLLTLGFACSAFPSFWLVSPSNGPAGGWSHMLRLLEAQWVLRQPACYWADGSSPGTNKLWKIPKWYLQTWVSSWMNELPKMAAACVSPSGCAPVASCLSERLSKVLPRFPSNYCLCPGSECVRFCMGHLLVESIALWLSWK